MALDEWTAEAIGYLLGMAEQPTARQVGARLGLDAGAVPVPSAATVSDPRFRQQLRTAPASVRLWLLQADDPAVNGVLFSMDLLPPGLNHDLAKGVVFAPDSPELGRADRIPRRGVAFLRDDPRRGRELALPEILRILYGTADTGNALRKARGAAREVRSAHWPDIAAAHDAEPFPGYARWALAERIDCPPALRARFGTHRKFGNRLNDAGIIEELGDLVTGVEPARAALPLLGLVSRARPSALTASDEVLRPLVRGELGGNVEAWAVLAQLLPEFVGTVAELVALAGAIAGPAPEDDMLDSEDDTLVSSGDTPTEAGDTPAPEGSTPAEAGDTPAPEGSTPAEAGDSTVARSGAGEPGGVRAEQPLRTAQDDVAALGAQPDRAPGGRGAARDDIPVGGAAPDAGARRGGLAGRLGALARSLWSESRS